MFAPALARAAQVETTRGSRNAPRSAAEHHAFSLALACRAPGPICRAKFGRPRLGPKSGLSAELLVEGGAGG